MSEAETRARSPLERVVEMGRLLAGPFCGQLPADVLGLGQEEWDGLWEWGIL